MTKLCWFDDDAFHSIVDDAKTFLEKVREPVLESIVQHISVANWQDM